MKKLLLTLMMAVTMVFGASAAETVIKATQLTTVPGTSNVDGYSFDTQKNGGSTNPTIHANTSTLRLYAKNTIKITGTKLTKIVFELNTTSGAKQYGKLTPSVGSINPAQAAGDTQIVWEGDATEITFTVSDKAEFGTDQTKAGQVHILQFTITGEAGSVPDTPAGPGASIDDPMTVAQALAACQDNGPQNVYVKGVVTKVGTVYSEQYNNVTFNIADNATDAEVLEAFRAKWGADVTATADKNPQVGATVIVFGNLKIYSGKKELDAGCQIVKYEAPALPSAGLAFPEKTYSVNVGDAFTAPALTKVTPAAAAYTSSKPAVAEVDPATGAVTIKTYGTTVITAKTEATSEYLAGEASYTLEVLNPAITAENPLSLAEALAVCENEPHNVYVKGVVTEVVTAFDSNYNNMTFNMAESAEATDLLQAYRCKWGADVTAPADNNPAVGVTVVVCGDLKVYKDMKEFNAGCQIVKYNVPSGINDVIAADADAPVEYYNLQGVRVANPENGLYIRVQGKNASKVLVK